MEIDRQEMTRGKYIGMKASKRGPDRQTHFDTEVSSGEITIRLVELAHVCFLNAFILIFLQLVSMRWTILKRQLIEMRSKRR